MSHVLKALNEVDQLSVGQLSVSGNRIQYVGSDGTVFYLDLNVSIIDLLQHGGTTTARTRLRSGY